MKKIATTLTIAAMVATPASAQLQQPAYASAEDLVQAARCTVAKYIEDARIAKLPIESSAGNVTITRALEVKSASGGGVGADFLPIAASGNLSSAVAKTVALSDPLNFKKDVAFTQGCKTFKVRTLKSSGRRAQSLGWTLFTLADASPKKKDGSSYGAVTVTQKFGRTRGATAGAKFNFFGLFKVSHESSTAETFENGFSVTFCFRKPPSNAMRLPYDDKSQKGVCA